MLRMNHRASEPEHRDGPLIGSALEAGVQVGDFRIERRIGAGGMGIVYQARQVSLNRPVALKVLGQALTRVADVTRFQREAQAAARLKHPAIAQVYYIGQDRHLCYLAMELIDGVSLRRVLDRLGMTQANDSSLDSIVKSDLLEEPTAAAVRFDLPTEATPASDNAKPAAEANAGGRRQSVSFAAGPRAADEQNLCAASLRAGSGTRPRRWPMPTSRAWFTATSSRTTCCSIAAGRCT